MHTPKKPEESGKQKGSTEVFLRLHGPVRDWLEDERERRGGEENGIRLQPIITEKLTAQMRHEKRKK